MKINIKAPLTAATVALSFITVAHAAQPQQNSQRQSAPMAHMGQMPMGQMPMIGGQMMNDPQMRERMGRMMQGCHRMMQSMANMDGQPRRAR